MASGWTVLVILIAIGGFLFFANMVAKDQLGVSITDVAGITQGIPYAELSAPSIETAGDDATDSGIARAKLEKNRLEADYNSESRRVSALNGSSAFRKQMAEDVGDSYSAYVFCIYSKEDAATGTEYYKTFEWTILMHDGAITQFEKGAPGGSVTVSMRVDAETAEDLISGNFEHTALLDGMRTGVIKIHPAIQADRVVKFFDLIGSGEP